MLFVWEPHIKNLNIKLWFVVLIMQTHIYPHMFSNAVIDIQYVIIKVKNVFCEPPTNFLTYHTFLGGIV